MPAGKIVLASTSTRQATKGKGYATKKYVKNLLNKDVETKNTWALLATNYASIGTTWIETPMSLIGQGANEVQRVGNKALITSMEIKGCIVQGSNETALDDAYNVVRIVLSNAMTNTPMASAVRTISTPIRNWNTPGLIKKYLDKYITLNVSASEKGGGDGYAPGVRQFKYYKRWKNGYPIEFTGAGTGDFRDNRIILSMISDSSAIVHPGFTVGYMAMTFKDA